MRIRWSSQGKHHCYIKTWVLSGFPEKQNSRQFWRCIRLHSSRHLYSLVQGAHINVCILTGTSHPVNMHKKRAFVNLHCYSTFSGTSTYWRWRVYLQCNVLQQSVLQHSLQLPVDLQRQVQSQPAVCWVWGIKWSHDASPSAQLGFVNVRSLWRESPWLFSQHIALDNSERV